MELLNKDYFFTMNCKKNIYDYLVRNLSKNSPDDYFLELDNKKVNVSLEDDGNYHIVYLDIKNTDYIEVHQFLSKKKLFEGVYLTFTCFKFLLKPQNEILFFYIFNQNNNEVMCSYSEYLNCFSHSLKVAHLDKIRCVTSFYLKNKTFDSEIYKELFSRICKRGDLYLAEIFLKEWNLSVKILNCCTLLAVKSGRIEILKLLIQNGANITLEKKALIKIAMENNYVDIFNYIFYPSIDSVYIKDDVFIDCMEKNNIEIIQSILSKCIFGKHWINCMFCNCYKSSSEVAELLICAGASVKKYGKSVLEKVVKANNKDLIDYLEKIV